MAVQPQPDSLLGRLAALPDPRVRKGRRYPLAALVGLVLLGMLHGRDSLRGAWVWARQHWGSVWRPLGARSPQFPSYNTVRDLLARLDVDTLDRQLRPWLEQLLDRPLGGVSADGKVLRGSKRDGAAALHVVSLVAHEGATILGQREAQGGDEVAALLMLLSEVPLKGRIISMDAGLLNAQVTQTITQAHGDFVGSVKGNQAEVQALLDEWVAEAVLSPHSNACLASARTGGGDRAPTAIEAGGAAEG
jgi:predicted transposase YbfD/YdcC